MASVLVQLITVMGVVVGAGATFVSTRAVERARWRRERDTRWDVKKLERCEEFAALMRHLIDVANRVSAARGIETTSLPMDPSIGVEKLADAQVQVSARWESLLLLCDPATIAAAVEWRHAVWRLEWLARGLRTGQDDWNQAAAQARSARQQFYDAARADLGVSGGAVPSYGSPAWLAAEAIVGVETHVEVPAPAMEK